MWIFYAGLASYLFVFLKAFQQRNVAGSHFWPILPISYLMAATEVYVISVVVRTGFDPVIVLSIGTGAGLGAISATVLHDQIFGRLRRKD